ncbi:MAG: Calx-beta domain-containing protein [Caldilineaceae bacterium]
MNTTSALFASGLQVSEAVTATLSVQPPPTFTKAFSPTTIYAGEAATLTFTLDNSASVLAATSLAFTDTLPAGLTVASPSNASKTCTGGVVNASGGSITYSGGSLNAGASCTVQLKVTTNTAGSYPNTSGHLTSSSGDSGTAAATLTVDPAANLVLTKHDDTDPLAAGSALTYTLIITNQGPSPATSVLVTDTRPSSASAATVRRAWVAAGLGHRLAGCRRHRNLCPHRYRGRRHQRRITTAVATSAVYDPQPAAAVVTETMQIYDNFFSIGDVSVDEGDSGQVQATFTISRTDNTIASSVDAERRRHRQRGTDYVAPHSTTVNFGSAALTQTVGVTVTGDLLFENDETFTVTLSNAVYGSISDAAAVATIRNDDSAPQLSINDQTGMENSGALTFTVSLDTVSGLPVSVVYSTTNGTAIAGEDYQVVTNTLDPRRSEPDHLHRAAAR